MPLQRVKFMVDVPLTRMMVTRSEYGMGKCRNKLLWQTGDFIVHMFFQSS